MLSYVQERVSALKKAGKADLKLHPHGFIQLDLSGDRSTRLHVWDDDLPRTASENTIHDHVWDFTSEVLCGRLKNIEFRAGRDDNGDWEEWVARKERHEGARGGKNLVATGNKFKVDFHSMAILAPGSVYDFPAFALHDSVGVGLTATLFTKGQNYGGDPQILCKIGENPDGELPKEIEYDLLWEKVVRAINL